MEIAAEVGIHPAHLSRSFRRRFGCTVADYLRRRRIDWARQALEGGDASLAQIALAAGFADQAHFSHRFKEATGLSPAAFRARAHRAAAGVTWSHPTAADRKS